MTTEDETAATAYAALGKRAKRFGLRSDAERLGYDGEAVSYQYEAGVPDTVGNALVTAVLTVVVTTDKVIVRLIAKWRSAYGNHVSFGEYTIDGAAMTITPRWEQTVPPGAHDYHMSALTALRIGGEGSALRRMLWDGTDDRVISMQELDEINTIAERTIPLL